MKPRSALPDDVVGLKRPNAPGDSNAAPAPRPETDDPAVLAQVPGVGRLLFAAFVAAAVLATTGSTLGWLGLYYAAKPAAMLLAMGFVLVRARSAGGLRRFDALLLAALAGSLAGDVFLMLPGNYFIPGLASFLLAHLCYIALLRQDAPWFSSRAGLLTPLGFGALMYAALWSGLPDPVLRGAVAAYVLVIGLMAAQAIGRASVLRNRRAQLVALGACIFMLSDTLIAINRFLQPVPLSALWILSTYYLAQVLIVVNAREASTTYPAPPLIHPRQGGSGAP